MTGFQDLRTAVSAYLTDEQVAQIEEAYAVSTEAHEGQKRYSGEPYIIHPVAVATILAGMRMDSQSIIAALLHDVIEDSEVEKEVLAKQFGEKVAELVDGVSKLTKIKFKSQAEFQAENFRKMMMAMAEDIRVIIIKLADRLHNMRTIGALPDEKRRRKALETLEIYAPIANRLGMNSFKTEFEDLGFAALYPMRYRVLKEAVQKIKGNRREVVSTIETAISQRLAQQHIDVVSLWGREKHIYSIYKKMREKRLPLSEVMDVYAFRILVETVDQAYRVLGVIHNLYKPVPGRFKDYIAIPKNNGYQSLHTSLLGPFGLPIETQIRTAEMERMAENGIAAHWLYKTSDEDVGDAQARAREWFKELLELQKNTGSSLEFIESVKVDLYPDEVYLFTPKGDILSLPAGATPVDFAYAVHTDVGDTCVAAKIDRRLAPLSTRLSNGQTVEIITAQGAYPGPAWLGFVVTSKARTNIRSWLKAQKRSESVDFGRRLLDRALHAMSSSVESVSQDAVDALLREYQLDNLDELYEAIGTGQRLPALVAKRILTVSEAESDSLAVGIQMTPLAIRGTEGMAVSYGRCCFPIPGDPIIGYFSAGKGIVIHHEGCKNLIELRNTPEKCIHVKWEQEVTGDYDVEIKVHVLNRQGVLASVAASLTDNQANIVNVTIDECDEVNNIITFLIRIQNRAHLARIMRHLRAVKHVNKIVRTRV